jgi:hypothetical protein
MKSLIAAIVVLASLAVAARGQTPGPNAAVKTTTVPLDRLNEQQARNVKTEWVTYKGRKALRVIDTAPSDVADGIQLVILNKPEFRDGTIEIELTGEPSPTAKSTAPRGFVGVAFIEVHGDKARLYVQGAPQPALVVNDLKQAQGKIALWVGTETIAHFANLRVSQ